MIKAGVRFSILAKVLTAMTIFVVLTGIAVSVGVVNSIRPNLVEKEERHLALTAEAAANKISNNLSVLSQSISGITGSTQFAEYSKNKELEDIRALFLRNEDKFVRAAFISSDFNELVAYEFGRVTTPVDRRNDELILDAAWTTNKVVWGRAPFFLNGRRVIAAAMARTSFFDEFIGTGHFLIPFEKIIQREDLATPNGVSQSILITSDGDILLATDPDIIKDGRPNRIVIPSSFRRSGDRNLNNSIGEIEISGNRAIAATATIPSFDWLYVHYVTDQKFNQPINDLIQNVVLIICIILVFLIIISWYVVRRDLRPIEDLTKAAQALAEGEHSGEVKVRSNDEFGELARVFNHMKYNLGAAHDSLTAELEMRQQAENELRESEERYQTIVEDQTEMICRSAPDGSRNFVNESYCKSFGKTKEELIGRSSYEGMATDDHERLMRLLENLTPENPSEKFEISVLGLDGEIAWQQWTMRAIFDGSGQVTGYQSVGNDVTERHRADNAVQLALAEAERANQAKTEFLATMSHEFRTPLNAILGFSEMLRSQYFGPLGSDNYNEYANDIHHSGEHMLALVNDVLDIAAIEAGKRELVNEVINIDELLRECIRKVEKAASDGGISLSLDVPSDIPPLYTDRRSVIQIVLNILSNSIKFTDPDGSIVVSANVSNGRFLISLVDTGIGIPADKLVEVTEPFSQADSNPHRAQEGTGLGLAIVKSLVQTLDGEILIESVVGEGTSITITFLLRKIGQYLH